MANASWRTALRRLLVTHRARSLGRGGAVLGRNLPLEPRVVPDGTAATSQLATPPANMPGLADLDLEISGAVRRAWKVPSTTATDRWVVALRPDQDASVLSALGATQATPIEYWANSYIVDFAGPHLVMAFPAAIEAVGGASFFYPLIARQMKTRFVPDDTLFRDQWHLQNRGQTGGLAGADAKVVSAWDLTTSTGTPIRGDGVLIGIVDDGLQHSHPDLIDHYVAAHSRDFNDGDNDPNPDPTFDTHGTPVAGVAAGVGNNGLGVSGAAMNASLAGLRLLGGSFDDTDEAAAIGFHRNAIDIYNNSWGPIDDGTLSAPGPLMLAAMRASWLNGRSAGQGNIITWAAGNGLGDDDNVNYDGYANSRYVIAVGAIDHNGQQSSYSEPGAAMLVTAYSSGAGVGITTTDLVGSDGDSNGDYTDDFGGTSSATPLVSGVVALMLQANPALTPRDVQNILVRTARKNDPFDGGWSNNAAGYHVNHKYGFGAIDAHAAVQTALNWTSVPDQLSASSGTIAVNRTIPDGNLTGLTSTFTLAANMQLEHVEVLFNAQHNNVGHLRVALTSPSGTVSVLAEEHANDSADFTDWLFSTVRNWGEESAGTWTLNVRDEIGGVEGTFGDWTLRVYGTPLSPRLTGIEPTALTYLENQSLAVTSTLVVTDPDSANLKEATVRITGNFNATQDVLTFVNQNGISGSFAGGVLTLSGVSSVANYQAALRSVQYTNLSENPSTAIRRVAFQVTDAEDHESEVLDRDITVVRVNDQPSFTGGPNVAADEDAGPQTVANWATNVAPGPPAESAQAVSFDVVSNSNTGLFSAQPAVSPAGTLTYTSALNAFGSATVVIHLVDNAGTANGGVDTSDTYTFTITVRPVNDAPVARVDAYNVNEDQTLTVQAPGLMVNDDDVENDPITPTKLTDPSHGTLTFNADGSITYKPVADYFGPDSFTYKVNDGALDSAETTVNITVAPVNDVPVANDDAVTALAGKPKSIGVLGNDTDVDGDVLRVQSYTRPSKGTLVRVGNSLIYKAGSGAVGTDAFAYTVSDGAGGTATATVHITIADLKAPQVRSVRLGYGPGGFIDLRSNTRTVLPWNNINRVEFVFSEAVTVAAGDLTLTGVNGGAVPLTFAWDAVNRTASWTWATGLPIDRYTLRLAKATIADLAGNKLGSDFARTFAVLPGDLDGNGLVSALDVAGIKKAITKPGGATNRLADVNGDGVVDQADVDLATVNLGKRV